MYWLRIGNTVVNLEQVTDVDLNVRPGAKSPPMVAINFASLTLIDNELEGRTLYFSGRDAQEIRGYFASLTGKHLTTLTEYEAAPPKVTEAPYYCPGCGVLPELCPCPPNSSVSKAPSDNREPQMTVRVANVKDVGAALADPDGTLKTAVESLKGKRVD